MCNRSVSGPEIRTGKLVGGKPVNLSRGQPYIFDNNKKALGNGKRNYTTYMRLHKNVEKGDILLVDDGYLGFMGE